MFAFSTKSAQSKQPHSKPGRAAEPFASNILRRTEIRPPAGKSVDSGERDRAKERDTFHAAGVPAFSPTEEARGAEWGKPLDGSTRAFMEPRFGRDFSGVRVHTDESAAQSAQRLEASAYTAGSDIVFNAGQYAPASREGRRLIAHELAHVVQQGNRSGGIAGAPSIDPSESLEHEAEMASAGVISGRQARVTVSPGAAMNVQRAPRVVATAPPEWLGQYRAGATQVTGNIWEVQLPTLGRSLVGPKAELSAYLSRQGLGSTMQAAHIVGGEHLEDIDSALTYDNSPCVAVSNSQHSAWTTAVNHQQSSTGPYGSRARGNVGRTNVSRQDVAELYDEVYDGFPEMQAMARRIIRYPNRATMRPARTGSLMDAHQGTKVDGKAGSPMDAHQTPKVGGKTASPMDAHQAPKIGGKAASPMDAHQAPKIGGKAASPMDAHQAPKIGGKAASPMDAHQTPKIGGKGASPMDVHQGTNIGADRTGGTGERTGGGKGGGPIGAFNTLMNITFVIDMLNVLLGSGSIEQKVTTVGKAVVIGELSGVALETLVGSELAGPVGFVLGMRSDNASFNREQEINEYIDDQTNDLWERFGNWAMSHPPPAVNPWGIHNKAEARQYIIDKLVREEQERLEEKKRQAQQKLEDEEYKREAAQRAYDDPAAAAILGDPFPL